jgi:hypothetical protein
MLAELFAISLDLERLAERLESQPPGHAVVEQIDVGILELHYPPAIDADEVVVRGFIKEVRIVSRLVVAQIDLTQQFRLHQQAQRVEERGMNLRGIDVLLAHVPMQLEWRLGRVHRGWCTVHVDTALSRELWAGAGWSLSGSLRPRPSRAAANAAQRSAGVHA